jgi:hypothetical protein
MKYIINSNKNYSKITLKRCVVSLLENNIHPDDIIVVLGGSEEEDLLLYHCGMYNCIKTKMNAIDQTTFYLITEKENMFFDDYYFYFHDTSWVGLNFKNTIKAAEKILNDNTQINTISISNQFSGNMGIYKKDYLVNSVNTLDLYVQNRNIFTDKLTSNDPINIKEKKEIGYKMEDIFFRSDKNNYTFNSDKKILGKHDVYKTGNERVIFHYTNVDIYKANANTYVGDNHPLNTFLGCTI